MCVCVCVHKNKFYLNCARSITPKLHEWIKHKKNIFNSEQQQNSFTNKTNAKVNQKCTFVARFPSIVNSLGMFIKQFAPSTKSLNPHNIYAYTSEWRCFKTCSSIFFLLLLPYLFPCSIVLAVKIGESRLLLFGTNVFLLLLFTVQIVVYHFSPAIRMNSVVRKHSNSQNFIVCVCFFFLSRHIYPELHRSLYTPGFAFRATMKLFFHSFPGNREHFFRHKILLNIMRIVLIIACNNPALAADYFHLIYLMKGFSGLNSISRQ